jgi:CheY-like chemotaxis protein
MSYREMEVSMRKRLLAVDDQTEWLENFRAWIPEGIAEQDSAATTQRAVELLRRYRYDVVLLDLSMDVNDSFNRSNQGIQEYLATKPEGTQYIIVSGVVEKAEVRDSLVHLNAFDIIFKKEIEPVVLREKVAGAIEKAQGHQSELVMAAERRLLDKTRLEGAILDALGPKHGAESMYRIMDGLFRRIAPIASHVDRPRFVARGQHVFGLAWSRLLGTAVSVVMSNNTMTSQEESLAGLAEWLGYADRGTEVFARDANRVRLLVFEEPGLLDVHFDLPEIHGGIS